MFYTTFLKRLVPNADLFQFMKGPSHQRTEEEIELVSKNLGWDYSPVPPPCTT